MLSKYEAFMQECSELPVGIKYGSVAAAVSEADASLRVLADRLQEWHAVCAHRWYQYPEPDRFHFLDAIDDMDHPLASGSQSAVTLASQASPPVPPANNLPGEIVRKFTLGCACWWFIAALVHLGHNLLPLVHWPTAGSEAYAAKVEWPAPAALFEVAALHCHGTQVLIRDRSSLFSMETAGTSWEPVELGSAPADASPICQDQGCGLLRPMSNAGSSWSLTPMGLDAVPRDPDVATAWASCTEGACTVWSARWDGQEVTVSKLELDTSRPDTLTVRRRFPVRPSLSRSGDALPGRYSSVQALHFGESPLSLAVMFQHEEQSVLDVWDLVSGELQRLSLRRRYRGMCHNGRNLFLSRHEEGPILEVSPVPWA